MRGSKLLSLGDLALCMSQTLLLQLRTVKACKVLSNTQHWMTTSIPEPTKLNLMYRRLEDA